MSSSAVASQTPLRRPQIAISAPRPRNRSAIALPSPVPPPVTRIFLPANRPSTNMGASPWLDARHWRPDRRLRCYAYALPSRLEKSSGSASVREASRPSLHSRAHRLDLVRRSDQRRLLLRFGEKDRRCVGVARCVEEALDARAPRPGCGRRSPWRSSGRRRADRRGGWWRSRKPAPPSPEKMRPVIASSRITSERASSRMSAIPPMSGTMPHLISMIARRASGAT